MSSFETFVLHLSSALIAFITTLITVPWLIKNLKNTKMVGVDFNKTDRRVIPEMGGLAVIIGFYVGVIFLILFDIISADIYYLSLLAIMGAAVVGIMDDLFNLRQRIKAILPFLFAIPLGIVIYQMAVDGATNGVQTFDTYIIGIDIGVLTVIAIPLGITCAANASNMLEGFNGLGVGLGIIMTSTMIIISLIEGQTRGLFLLVPLLGALFAFLYFNKYPAKIFPGDTLTLFTGAAIACAAVISHLKIVGALLFIPMIVEFFLKVRGRFRGENYGKPDEKGNLTYEGQIESLAHVLMRWKRLKEWQLVVVLWLLEISVCAVVILGVILL